MVLGSLHSLGVVWKVEYDREVWGGGLQGLLVEVKLLDRSLIAGVENSFRDKLTYYIISVCPHAVNQMNFLFP
jgi:hypothetical protein